MKDMNYTRIISMLMVVYLSFSPTKIFAQKGRAYQAYLSGDLNQWKSVIAEAQGASEEKDSTKTFELALTEYGLIAHSLFTGNEKSFDEYVPLAHELLDRLMDDNKSWAEPYAVSSFIMGFQIANSPMKAIYLGGKSMSRMSKALELNRQSPVVVQLYAGSKYFSPKFFGGDIHQAIENYQIAIGLFEKESRTDEWLYLDALAFLGKSYMRIGEVEKAIAVYTKALEVEPKFTWVKKQLLPDAQKRLINTK